MFHRTFEGNPPYITFTAAWEQDPFGNLVPGQTVHIAYDPNRLPESRSITAFYQFAPNGPVESKQLETPAGPPPPRPTNDAVEATCMTTTIDIPHDATELILWFQSDAQWDSNFGTNYVFRFTAIDIQGEEADVVSGAFRVSLTALPVVENVSVQYTVTNNPLGQPFGGTAALQPGEVTNGRRAWSASEIVVPANAKVRFAFVYTVDGRTFVDDNDRTGFWAPKPLPTYKPEKFARMASRA